MGKGGRYAGTMWDLEGSLSMGWENCVWSEWHTHLLPRWLVPGSDCHFTYEPGRDPRSGARSPRADSRAFIRDIGIARSVAQLVPQADLGSITCSGSHTQPGDLL